MHRGERKRGEGEERKRERIGGGKKYARACGREREREGERVSSEGTHLQRCQPIAFVCVRAYNTRARAAVFPRDL